MKLRKIFASVVMVATVVAMSGAFAAPVKAAAQAGDLIKTSSASAVYYLGSDGKRYVFPSQDSYFSWYQDFSGVVTVSASELSSYPMGGNIVMRPGTKMVKITSNPDVYVVEANGVLRKIQTEAQAAGLFGTNWARRVVDVADSFFFNYTIGTPLTIGAVPMGSLVKVTSSNDIYYFDGVSYRKFATEAAFAANRFVMSNVIVVSAIGTVGTEITAKEDGLSKTSQSGIVVGPVITGSGMTVALSANTAASTNVVTGQAIANLGSFNFTAAADGAVKVTTLKVKRIGISADTALTSIYLYEGNTKLTDAGSLSAGYVTFANPSGIFTVAAGTTKTITVKADIYASATGNVGVAVNAASDIIASGSTITGSFPMSGNLMSITTVTDLASVTVGTLSGTGNVNAGTMNASLWSAPLTVSGRAVNMSYVNFKQIGSMPADGIQNLKLYVNGTQAGSATSITSDNRVVFDLSAAPVYLGTGSRTLELRGDIIKGSNSTFSFSLQTPSDILLVDSNYSVNITAATFPQTTSSATINTGSIVVAADATFATTQVVKNSANVTLAKYTMKAYGEDIKVSSLRATTTFNGVIGANDGVSNLTLYVNGAQVGSSGNALYTAQAAGSDKTNVFGTSNLFTIPAGSTYTIEVKGDLTMASSTATQITTSLGAAVGVYQGVTSYTTFPLAATGGVAYASRTLSIVSTGLATMYQNNAFAATQTLAPNVANLKIASFVIQAGASEAVRYSDLAVVLTTGGALAADTSGVSNLYISETPSNIIGNPTTSTIQHFPVNFTLAAGQSKTIDVYATIANDAGTLHADLSASAVTNVTTITITGAGYEGVSTDVTGQALTFAAGTLASSTIALRSSLAPAKLVLGGIADTAAVYNFKAGNGAAKIKSLKFFVSAASTSTPNITAISSLKIGDVTAQVDGTGYAYFDDTLNIDVPVGNLGTDVTVVANYNTVGTNGVTTKTESRVTLTDYKYQVGSNAPVLSVTSGLTNAALTSNTMISVAAKPLVEKQTSPARSLSVGIQEVLRFSVTAQGGPISLKNFEVTPTFNGISGNTTIDGVYDLNDMSTNLVSAGGVLTTNTATSVSFTTAELITTSKTYVVTVKVTTASSTVGANDLALSVTNTGDTAIGAGTNWVWTDLTYAVGAGYDLNGFLVKALPGVGATFTR